MNNAILFYFNMNVSFVKKINKNYYFNYINNDYVVYTYERDVREAQELYYLNMEFINTNKIGYDILLTKDNDILFLYEGSYYVLMRIPNIKNRVITYNDVLNFNYHPRERYKLLDKSNWGLNWANKIDFIEHQFSQMNNKYKIIDSSIDYFLGVFENAVSYYNDNVKFNMDKVLCHKRINSDMDLLDLFNPINFVIDYKERNLGDYLKSYVINSNYSFDNLDNLIYFNDRDRVILLICRILFPSYYFDVYEDIVLGNMKEDEIRVFIDKRKNVLFLINYLFDKYDNFNIPSLRWIKKEIS